MSKADDIIAKTEELPAAPIVAVKLLSLLRNATQGNIDEVVETIEYDPALTARLLKCCNSAYLAGHSTVDSVQQAVLRLGYYEVLRIVMVLSMGQSLSKNLECYGVDADELWSHSVACALATQKIMTNWDSLNIPSSVAFTAGLLHDIGKVVLNPMVLPHVHTMGEMMASQNATLVEAESATMGVNHAEMGGALLRKWKLAQVVADAVESHHSPSVEFGPVLAGAVYLANYCAHTADPSYGWSSSEALRADVMTTFRMNQGSVDQVISFIQNESSRIKDFMKA